MNITTSLLAISALYPIFPTGIPGLEPISSTSSLTSNLTAPGTASLGPNSSTNNLTSNIIINSTIPSAPLYNNVTAGEAWVIPASNYDLGARAMTCECFDPDTKCCMPATASKGPFCVPQNGTCCSDTYCQSNQTCCGDACCASGFNCLFQSQGPTMSPSCCPVGQTCASAPMCFDASSPTCSNAFSAASQCCPPTLPYCRNFKPMGIGCYASAAGSPTFTFTATALNASSTKHHIDPTIIISYSETTTETASLIPMPSGAYSLSFPTHGPRSGGGGNVSTTFVLTVAGNSTSISNATTRRHTSTITTTKSHAITTSASSEKSTLCFNTDKQSRGACPSTSADDGGFLGASTVSSGVPRFLDLGLVGWLAGGVVLFVGVA